jgi:hypothetical protein
MKYFARTIFALMFTLAGYCTYSQNIYENYFPRFNSDTAIADMLRVRLYNNNFVKNNEYFGPYTEGITYIGSILQPEVTWSLSNNFSLSAGWYFRHYYGQDGFEKSLPVIRARYTFSPGMQVIVGQLDGQLNHGYLEPIYNTDNYFIKNPEYGVQILADRKRIHTDIFMDWETFLLPGEAHQEQIAGGLLASYTLNDYKDDRGLSVHFQSLIHHFGGQVDNSDNNIESRANVAAGLKYSFLPASKIVSRLSLSSFYLQALEISQTNTLPFKSGFALQTTLSLENKWVTINTSWFHGEYFFAPMGDYLFQSVSQFNTWYIGEKRDLITSKLLIGQEVMKGVSCGFRLETYYDLQRKSLDFSYGLNISVNALVFEKMMKTVKN